MNELTKKAKLSNDVMYRAVARMIEDNVFDKLRQDYVKHDKILRHIDEDEELYKKFYENGGFYSLVEKFKSIELVRSLFLYIYEENVQLAAVFGNTNK